MDKEKTAERFVEIISSGESELTKKELEDLIWYFEYETIVEEQYSLEEGTETNMISIVRLKEQYFGIIWKKIQNKKMTHPLFETQPFPVEFKEIEFRDWETRLMTVKKGWVKKDTDMLLEDN